MLEDSPYCSTRIWLIGSKGNSRRRGCQVSFCCTPLCLWQVFLIGMGRWCQENHDSLADGYGMASSSKVRSITGHCT